MSDHEAMQCCGAGCLVDTLPANPDKATCPACGRLVDIGGWPSRYLAHTPDERSVSWAYAYKLAAGFDETGSAA